MSAVMSSARRMLVMSAAGVFAGLATSALAPWQLSMLLGWCAAAMAYLVSVWRTIGRADGLETRRLSTVEDDNRAERGLLIVTASVVSLAGAVAGLMKERQLDGGGTAVLLTVVALATVVLSWIVVHTDFTLRYAHLYYRDPVGGIDFAGVDLPDYRDFAYLSFTIGMTYQVSDTGLLTRRFRRVVLTHASVSYLFGVVIIAAVINIVAGLVR